MGPLSDFISGRSNRAARDFAVAGLVLIALGVGVVHVLATALQRAERSELRLAQMARELRDTPRSTVVARSVLDDPLVTGSATAGQTRTVIDPCGTR